MASTAAEVRSAVTGPIAFVPTMGALHEGHASLIRAAAAGGGAVVVSDFVNPAQFAPGEDFERYPRDLDGDARIAERAGADVLFAPGVGEIYPAGFSTTVDPGPLGDDLCGRTRPGHFAGVATVVTRLFGLVRPVRAYFGCKDYQQLTILRHVVRDLALGVDIAAAPTVRESDGLALSSRNRYLDADERTRAAAVPATLRAVATAYAEGERAPATLLAAGASVPAAFDLEYLELRDADTLGSFDPARRAVALIACRVGSTRLIDNVILDPTRPDAAKEEL